MRRIARSALALSLAGGLLACGGEDKGEVSGLSMDRQTNQETREPQAPTPADPTANRSPTVLKVELQPAAPVPGERVGTVVSAIDPERDPIELVYRWQVNGRAASGDKPDLMVPSVPKNSLIQVEVVARDGTSESPPVLASVRVGNQAPRMLGASIEPAGEITAAHPVSIRPNAMDPDRDGLDYRYTWRVNGRRLSNDLPVLPTDQFKRGDSISFTVIASDGETESEPYVIEPIRVANAAPRITSRPTGLNADGVLRYQVTAEDADGDPRFRYRLVKGPKGMEMDLFNGELTWTPIPSQAGKHSIELEVDDMRGGTDRQIFDLDVSFDAVPAAPASSEKP